MNWQIISSEAEYEVRRTSFPRRVGLAPPQPGWWGKPHPTCTVSVHRRRGSGRRVPEADLCRSGQAADGPGASGACCRRRARSVPSGPATTARAATTKPPASTSTGTPTATAAASSARRATRSSSPRWKARAASGGSGRPRPEQGHVRIYLDGASRAGGRPAVRRLLRRQERAVHPLGPGPHRRHGLEQLHADPLPEVVQDRGRQGLGRLLPLHLRDLSQGHAGADLQRAVGRRGERGRSTRPTRSSAKAAPTRPGLPAEAGHAETTVTIEPGRPVRGRHARRAAGRSPACGVKGKFDDREDEIDALRELVLRITWDGEDKPAVWSPLGDFFGTAPGVNLYRSFPLGMTEDGCLLQLVHAVRHSARVRAGQRGQARARTVDFEVTHAPLARPIEQLGRFHAKWHRDAFLPEDPMRAIDWTMLKTEGRGPLLRRDAARLESARRLVGRRRREVLRRRREVPLHHRHRLGGLLRLRLVQSHALSERLSQPDDHAATTGATSRSTAGTSPTTCRSRSRSRAASRSTTRTAARRSTPPRSTGTWPPAEGPVSSRCPSSERVGYWAPVEAAKSQRRPRGREAEDPRQDRRQPGRRRT